MKVFISWSGPKSHRAAQLLHGWLKIVLQATEPFLSSADIDRGAVWFDRIQDKLKDCSHGIICLTRENKDRPWILFEAGAIAKGLSSNRVCTLLIDLDHSEVKEPLSHFNHTFFNKESFFLLLKTLNESLALGKLEDEILRRAFESSWQSFENEFKAEVIDAHESPNTESPRSQGDILIEVLELARNMNQRLARFESAATSHRDSYQPKYTSFERLMSESNPESPRALNVDDSGSTIAAQPFEGFQALMNLLRNTNQNYSDPEQRKS